MIKCSLKAFTGRINLAVKPFCFFPLYVDNNIIIYYICFDLWGRKNLMAMSGLIES